MSKGKKGDWVRISEVVLDNTERNEKLPEDTKRVDLKMWVKGYLQDSGEIGRVVEIKTKTGRKVKGVLEEINPSYKISFGEYIPELGQIGDKVRKELEEVEEFERK